MCKLLIPLKVESTIWALYIQTRLENIMGGIVEWIIPPAKNSCKTDRGNQWKELSIKNNMY